MNLMRKKKRAIIGKAFFDVQEEELRLKVNDGSWLLGQGTIYPDTIESGCGSKSAKIKTHHNRVSEILKLY